MAIFEDKKTVQLIRDRLGEDKPLIQVILGPRQVGKTTLVTQLIEKAPTKYHFASGDGVPSPLWIDEQWQKAQQQKQILVIDEIQKIPSWSETVKRLWDSSIRQKKYQRCLFLGSSSLQLNQGITESLTGRFEVIDFCHWTFQQSKKIATLTMDDYLKFGGYPGSYDKIKDLGRWQKYMRSAIVETVIGKDILTQASVRSPALFRHAFYIFANLPAQVMSYNKMLGQLQDRGNTDLIKHYLELFEGAMLLTTLQKFSKNEIRKRTSTPKILLMCPALATFHRLDNLEPQYMGHVFENLVGVLLHRFFSNVSYWSEGDHEVDFVVEESNKIFAIEVKSGRNKKAKSLEVFLKKYPKAHPVFIDKASFPLFEKDPKNFVLSVE